MAMLWNHRASHLLQVTVVFQMIGRETVDSMSDRADLPGHFALVQSVPFHAVQNVPPSSLKGHVGNLRVLGMHNRHTV